MDLAKAQKVLRKNFKEYGVTASVDEETLLMFCCVDLVREDMAGDVSTSPVRSSRKKTNDVTGFGEVIE